MQIKALAKYAGVSVRTLHYYDEIGLLKPAVTDRDTGYRYYDEQSVQRMQEILFFRELDFSLKEIGNILSSAGYDRQKALAEHRELLILKKNRLEKLIAAVDEAMKGEIVMDRFENNEYEQYKQEAKLKWGGTQAYAEYEEKRKKRGADVQNAMFAGMEDIFAGFATCMRQGNAPSSDAAQALVKQLQEYITANFYNCTDSILAGLGQMYTADERFMRNIDRNGEGTAAFAGHAIAYYCR